MTRPGIRKYPWLWCLVPGTDLAQEGPLLSLSDAHEFCEGSLIDGWRGPDLLCNQLLYVPAMAINRHTLVCQSFQRAFPPHTKCFSFAHCGCSRKGFRCLAFWPRGTSGPTCRASQNLATTGRTTSGRNNETCCSTTECSFEGYSCGWQREAGDNLGSQTSVGSMLLWTAVSSECSDDDAVAAGRVLGDVDGP